MRRSVRQGTEPARQPPTPKLAPQRVWGLTVPKKQADTVSERDKGEAEEGEVCLRRTGRAGLPGEGTIQLKRE